MMRLLIILFCVTVFLSGCGKTGAGSTTERSSTQVPEKASPQTAIPSPTQTIQKEQSFPNPNFGQHEQIVYSNIDKNEGWFLTQTTDNPKKMNVYHSTDQGKTWISSLLPTKLPWEQGKLTKDNLFASFSYEEKNLPSWILMTSDPAAGQMLKTLYQTTDNGKTWTMINDLSFVLNEGYPTGISFRNSTDGWIGVTSHGSVLVPLYRSKDGGKTWNLQNITLPKGYRHGDTQAPVFDSANPDIGTMKIEFYPNSASDTNVLLTYTTTDGGETWKLVNENK